MGCINSVAISGNLTRDPELRSTDGGTQVLTFGVAVNDRRRNQQTNEWEDVPNFVDCVVFGARAEALSRFLGKGSKVAVEGKLRYSSWERDGQRRSKLEVAVGEVEFLSPRNQQRGGAAPQDYQGAPSCGPQPYGRPAYDAPQQAAPQGASHAPSSAPPAVDVYDDEVEF